MKKLLLVLAIVLTFTGAAFAEKIAVVDIQRCAMTSEAGKRASAEMQAMEKDFGAKGQVLRDALISLENDYRAQEKMLTEAAKKTKVEELQRKAEEYQTTMMGFENTIQQKNDELTTKILTELEKIIPAVAKEQGFDVVLQAQVLVYGPNIKDITNDVINKFNQQIK